MRMYIPSNMHLWLFDCCKKKRQQQHVLVSSMSQLVAPQKYINLIVERSTACDFTVCMFSTADLEIRNAPFQYKVSSDNNLPQGPLWFPFGSYWFLPKNTIYYCPGCSKSFASVGLVKNLLTCSSTHSKELFVLYIVHVKIYIHFQKLKIIFQISKS